MSLESGEMVAEEKKKQSATFWTGRLTWQDKHETRSLSRCCHEPINKVNAPRFLRRPPICAIADVCCCNHGAQLIVGNKFRIQVDSVLNLSDRWRFSASQVYLGIVKNCSLFGPINKCPKILYQLLEYLLRFLYCYCELLGATFGPLGG